MEFLCKDVSIINLIYLIVMRALGKEQGILKNKLIKNNGKKKQKH